MKVVDLEVPRTFSPVQDLKKVWRQKDALDDDVVKAMTAQVLQQMPYYYTSAASTVRGFIPASFVYPSYDPRYKQ